MVTPQPNAREIQLENVLHMQSMKKNLLSVLQLTKKGNHVLFAPNDVKVYKNRASIMAGRKIEPIYIISTKIDS